MNPHLRQRLAVREAIVANDEVLLDRRRIVGGEESARGEDERSEDRG